MKLLEDRIRKDGIILNCKEEQKNKSNELNLGFILQQNGGGF